MTKFENETLYTLLEMKMQEAEAKLAELDETDVGLLGMRTAYSHIISECEKLRNAMEIMGM